MNQVSRQQEKTEQKEISTNFRTIQISASIAETMPAIVFLTRYLMR